MSWSRNTAAVAYSDLSKPPQPLHVRASVDLRTGEAPRVFAIHEVERTDGQSLVGGADFTLRLDRIAVAVALESLSVEAGMAAVWDWSDRRLRDSHVWTEAIDAAIIRVWRHAVDHRCMGAFELAKMIGVREPVLRTHLSDLRKKHPDWDIPRVKPGRRPRIFSPECLRQIDQVA